MKGSRNCPICPECDSTKFKIFNNEGNNTLIEYRKRPKYLRI